MIILFDKLKGSLTKSSLPTSILLSILLAYTDENKAKVLAKSYPMHYNFHLSPYQLHPLFLVIVAVNNFLAISLDSFFEVQPIVSYNILKNLKSRKALGYDNITNNALQHLPKPYSLYQQID